MKSKSLLAQLGVLALSILLFCWICKNFKSLHKDYEKQAEKIVEDNSYTMEVPEDAQMSSKWADTDNKDIQTKHGSLVGSYLEADAYTVVDVNSLEPEEVKLLFTVAKIPDDIFKKMKGKSYKEDCKIAKNDLRYLRVLHVDGHGNTRIGELVVNASIAKKVKTIFKDLYDHQYPIEKMVLVDHYDADDNASMADNNSSAFNYRVVEGTNRLSKHSQGLAIDINPLYNPYIHQLNGQTVCSPAEGAAYQDRSKKFDYKIDENDYAYKVFTQNGFTWGGSWNSVKDYQHFQI